MIRTTLLGLGEYTYWMGATFASSVLLEERHDTHEWVHPSTIPSLGIHSLPFWVWECKSRNRICTYIPTPLSATPSHSSSDLRRTAPSTYAMNVSFSSCSLAYLRTCMVLFKREACARAEKRTGRDCNTYEHIREGIESETSMKVGKLLVFFLCVLPACLWLFAYLAGYELICSRLFSKLQTPLQLLAAYSIFLRLILRLDVFLPARLRWCQA